MKLKSGTGVFTVPKGKTAIEAEIIGGGGVGSNKMKLRSAHDRRVWFEGLRAGYNLRALSDLKITTEEILLSMQWKKLFPNCTCDRPLQECPGCMSDE